MDDVFENIETGELHIVDYKSTSQDGGEVAPDPLDESFLMPPEDPKKKDYMSYTPSRNVSMDFEEKLTKLATLLTSYMLMAFRIERNADR